MGENHRTCFNIYLEYYIHENHQLEGGTNPLFTSSNSLYSPTPTGRRFEPEGSSNSLDYLAPTGRRLQPPSFMSTNSKEYVTPLQAPIYYLKTQSSHVPPNLPKL
jgi:hypothetical protein